MLLHQSLDLILTEFKVERVCFAYLSLKIIYYQRIKISIFYF